MRSRSKSEQASFSVDGLLPLIPTPFSARRSLDDSRTITNWMAGQFSFPS